MKNPRENDCGGKIREDFIWLYQRGRALGGAAGRILEFII
jgi:hypothetical protein